MGFVFYDFNDSETINRLVNFQEQTEGFGLDTQNHLFKSYGTYYPRIILTNNISQIKMNLRLEVEQCVSEFQLLFENKPYIFWNNI